MIYFSKREDEHPCPLLPPTLGDLKLSIQFKINKSISFQTSSKSVFVRLQDYKVVNYLKDYCLEVGVLKIQSKKEKKMLHISALSTNFCLFC